MPNNTENPPEKTCRNCARLKVRIRRLGAELVRLEQAGPELVRFMGELDRLRGRLASAGCPGETLADQVDMAAAASGRMGWLLHSPEAPLVLSKRLPGLTVAAAVDVLSALRGILPEVSVRFTQRDGEPPSPQEPEQKEENDGVEPG